jgi:predicted dehydrogenase
MRIAVLGLGFMGSTHIKAMRTLPGVTLTAVCSNNPAALEGDMSGIQGNLGGPGEKFDFSNLSKHCDVTSVLADLSVDAVDICLPTDLHASVATQALQAGKHVLLEKPMALTAAECDALIAEAEKQKRVLMVAQVLRFFPMYQALRDALPRLGTVRNAILRRRCAAPAWSLWLKDKSKSGGGVFDLLIHDYDVALWLFGKPSHVSAVGYEALEQGIDVITANLHYASGLTVTVTGGWHHPKSYPFSMEYTVVADGGSIEYSSAGKAPTLYAADGSETALPQGEHDGYTEEIRYFADCATRGVSPDLCSPVNSAEATKLALLCNEARLKNGERIECRI